MTENSKSILIVEDDEDIQELEKYHCEKLGFKVYTALSTAAAKEWLGKIIPTLILLDIMMPDEHGLALCDWMKANSRYNGIPVIVVSALRDEETIQDALERGAVDYLVKPFDTKQFEQKVRRAESRSLQTRT